MLLWHLLCKVICLVTAIKFGLKVSTCGKNTKIKIKNNNKNNNKTIWLKTENKRCDFEYLYFDYHKLSDRFLYHNFININIFLTNYQHDKSLQITRSLPQAGRTAASPRTETWRCWWCCWRTPPPADSRTSPAASADWRRPWGRLSLSSVWKYL